MEPTPSSGTPPRFPDSLKLFEAFNQFLIHWANLSAQYLSHPPEDDAALPEEYSILFSNPFPGLLVVRGTRGLEGLLTEAVAGKGASPGRADKGILVEMIVLFWHWLARMSWGVDTRKMEPATLRASVPADWPDRKPGTHCLVFIQDHPLEIRCWSELTPIEVEAWRRRSKA